MRGIHLLAEYVHNHKLDLVALCRPQDPSFDNSIDIASLLTLLREHTLPFRDSDLDDIVRCLPLTAL